MTDAALSGVRPLDPRKFRDPALTADGQQRASVDFRGLQTLWVNTGTLCNLTCANCYIESSPRNDSLAYLTAAEVGTYLDEIARSALPTHDIGFTGGEPFMNPEIIAMLADALGRGHRALVLTNAMRPMMKLAGPLLELRARHGAALVIRVSLDHYGQALHESERGARSWAATMKGLEWLAANGFALNVAGRTRWGEGEESLRRGYARLFATHGLPIDADDPVALTLFPEMDVRLDVAEITVDCWGILGVSPDAMMCASARMVVKRKGASAPSVVACTLLPHDSAFDLGPTLAGAARPVSLKHPHCARFCVLGGGACSRT